jgi:hypothetical protein
MLRRLLKTILLVLCSLLILEGLSWVVFRFAFHERFSFASIAQLKQQRIDEAAAAHPAKDVYPALVVPHPFLGFVYNPQHSPKTILARHSVPVSDWGFLDDKVPFQAASDQQAVIGLFGGSVAFWFSVQGVDALLEELSQIPELRGKRLVVVRTALGGSKQPQQLMALSYLLALGGHFDIVVNLDGFNEVALAPATMVPKGVFPFFPRGWPEALGAVGDPTSSRLVGRVLYLEELAGDRARQFSRPVLRHSVFANALWRLLDRNLAGQLASSRAELEAYKPAPAAQRHDYAAVGPQRTYRNPEEMYQDLAGMWRRSSLQMQQICAANGILYFHFLQPNQYLEGTKPIGAAERQAAIRVGGLFDRPVQAGYPVLQAAGRELTAQGVAFTDMTRVFAGLSEPLYIDDCCHFNPKGNRILGHAMGRSIAAKMAERRRLAGAGTSPAPKPGGSG